MFSLNTSQARSHTGRVIASGSLDNLMVLTLALEWQEVKIVEQCNSLHILLKQGATQAGRRR